MLIKRFGNSEWKSGRRSTGTNGVAIRNSMIPEGPVLLLTKPEWADFLADVKDGDLDIT